MKRWQFVLSASVTLLAAAPVLSWADDDDDDSSLTSLITGGTREFTFNLNVVPDYEIRPRVPNAASTEPKYLAPATVQLWAFACLFATESLPYCDPNPGPTLPGPVLRVTQGDLVRVTFSNTHEKPHTLHLHGYHRNNVDGVHPVPPHENFLIEYVANPCGTYVYHCHVNTPLHQDRGMYGQFIVDCPATTERTVVHEFLLVVDEQPRDWPALGDDPLPETHEFIINGKSFVPASTYAPLNNLRTIRGDGTVVPGPMVVQKGDTVRLRLSSFGMAIHEMELFGPMEGTPAVVVLSSVDWRLPFEIGFPYPFPTVVQGSNPIPADGDLTAPLEVVTNHSLNVVFTAGAVGTYRFRSTNPVERRNYETLPDGTLLMGEPDQGGMQTVLVVMP